MNTLFIRIGMIMCISGGLAILVSFLAAMLYLASDAWITASYKFRGVCSGESLIREYKKNRAEFLKWKEEKNEQN